MRCSPRYSRSPKSLRRLFLDEFVGDLDLTGDLTVDATVGLRRAEELYDRVFLEYGDDSVAQLGGVHLACEQASNMLTKILEWGRLMAYLEQSTRYIPYDVRLGGLYRYVRPPRGPAVALRRALRRRPRRAVRLVCVVPPGAVRLGTRALPEGADRLRLRLQADDQGEGVRRRRGMLPAATLSNVGIYGTGQAFEALLLRMRAHPLPEARRYAAMMLDELRKVIPSFLTRVDRPDRGRRVERVPGAHTRRDAASVVQQLFADDEPEPRPAVTLTDFDPDGEDKVLAAICYPYAGLPDDQVLARVRRMSTDERARPPARVRRGARQPAPPAGARVRTHRLPLRRARRLRRVPRSAASPDAHDRVAGAVTAPWVRGPDGDARCRSRGPVRGGDGAERRRCTTRSLPELPLDAPYAVSLAYRVRFAMQMNAREAMHVLELRSSPQGHPSYRRVCQEMHRLIAEHAGHRALAAAMSHVDHADHDLERLASERAAEERRRSSVAGRHLAGS